MKYFPLSSIWFTEASKHRHFHMVIEHIKHCYWYLPFPWHTHAVIWVKRPTRTPEVERSSATLFINHSTSDCWMLLTALSASLLSVIWLQGQRLCKVTLLSTFIEPFRVLEIPEIFITNLAFYVSGILHYKTS